ncbi:Ktr system potassium uptake protein A [Planctomycetes bacterium Pan216]|uniref:Ktr system potassium uptake protein A n=1 Tax=Kolteria novifilia TaxID=2527975 RepID=A0A518B6H2_9BACT|nr:Ktr system potassium uptake protein A [Planctomycetes bacterium Pan216]
MAAGKQQYVVLGLGSFGSSLAKRLTWHGCRVIGVDFDSRKVESHRDLIYAPVEGDATSAETLEQLLTPAVDSVFIATGNNIESSILTALHSIEHGAKRVIAKGITEDHAKILHKIGVERVVFPDQEYGMEVADQAVFPNLLDTLNFDPNYGVFELPVGPSFVGQNLESFTAKLRWTFGISILAVKDPARDEVKVLPPSDFIILEHHVLLVIGTHKDMIRVRSAFFDSVSF